jgi:hypothetical protein
MARLIRVHPWFSFRVFRVFRGFRFVGGCAALSLSVAQAAAPVGAGGLGADESDPAKWRPSPDVQLQTHGQDFRRVDERIWHDMRLQNMDYGPAMGGTCEIFAEAGGKGQKLAEACSGLCIRLGDKRHARIVYEKTLGQCQGAWFGGVSFDGARFGFFNRPRNDVPPLFTVPRGAAWSREGSFDLQRPSDGYPAPREWLDWKGVHFHGERVVLEYAAAGVRVLEHPWVEEGFGAAAVSRSFEVAASGKEILLRIQPMAAPIFRYFGPGWMAFFDDQSKQEVALVGGRTGASEAQRQVSLALKDGWLIARIAPRAQAVTFKLLHGRSDEAGGFESLAAASEAPASLGPMLQAGVKLFPEEVETAIETEGDGAYVVDHILPPLKNPWNALCYFAGVDFLPDGRPAVCSAHGDVWIVSGLKSGRPRWKRFATGLYQPLGLKVVDGQICVIERGQITRVRDTDGDGEADFLEKVNNRWHSFGAVHAFDMGLEYGGGFFYFNKSGEWGTPTGASLLKVPADGSDAVVLASGLRHTNGLGMLPDGRVTCAGQQGNWTPSSRVDICREGGFYGLMEGAHTPEKPLICEDPLVWLPMDLDSSSADQVTAPKGWGPLGGSLLHLSWGQCTAIALFLEKVGGVEQAAACRIDMPRTLSGPARGRFSPADGQLYLACLNGWQCRNLWDGALDRVRWTGRKTYAAPVAARSIPGGLEITFGCELDPAAVRQPSGWKVRQWNYWWTQNYGSLDYSPRRRGEGGPAGEDPGHDALKVEGATLLPDRRTVRLMVADLQPAMQTRVVYALRQADGAPLAEAVDLTLHRLPLAPEETGPRPLTSTGTSAIGDAEFRLSFKPAAGGRCALRLREGQDGAAGYTLTVGDGACELTDIWASAHPGEKSFPQQAGKSPLDPKEIKAGEWNELRVQAEGRWIRVWINGRDAGARVENDTRAALFGRFALGDAQDCEVKDATIQRLP